MNKNKKIVLGLTAGAFVLAFIAIFMGFVNGFHREYWVDEELLSQIDIKFWDIIFNRDNIVVELFGGKSNAGLIITFVLTIISILMLGSIGVLNLTGKSNKKLNKGLIISAAVILLLIAILMLFSKGICAIPDEEKVEYGSYLSTTAKNKLLAGPICWAIFGLVGGVAMIVAAVQNKKAWAQA